MAIRGRVLFVTTPHLDPWSGAEELWSRTAIELVSQGVPVSASVWEESLECPRMRELQARGVDLCPWPRQYSLRKHPWKRLRSWHNGAVAFAVERLLDAGTSAIAVLSDGGILPPIQLLELCVAKRIPFVTISHAGSEAVSYFDDDLAKRYRAALAAALRCFFVAQRIRLSAEKQIGGELANADIVRNPFNVSYDASVPWPKSGTDAAVRFACVGRLHPPAKGQDILFEALAQSQWKCRNWRLSIYGEGSTRLSLEWLARRLGLSERVKFAGFVKPEEIWAENHVLVMPSRYEGLPIVIVEAMLCSRPSSQLILLGMRKSWKTASPASLPKPRRRGRWPRLWKDFGRAARRPKRSAKQDTVEYNSLFRRTRRASLQKTSSPWAGFVTLPGSGQEGARAEFDSRLGGRSPRVRYRFGSELSQRRSGLEAGKNMLGPSLHGLIGRKAGSVPGYAYSPAMKNANVTWTDDTLSKYLSDPKAFIPGDKMAFAGVKDPSKLGDLLAYLNQATK
jgi:glycosyltransferase involved in cell wall biosynthesis